MVNENNYDGANVTVVGRAGGPVQYKDFQSGSSIAELSVAVGKGYKDKSTNEWVDQGTDWYTITATKDYAVQNWPPVGKGDKVRVDEGRLEAREYEKRDGTPGLGLTVKFGTLSVIESKSAPQGDFGGSDDKPF
jgi:single-stranded DNA-binding protein